LYREERNVREAALEVYNIGRQIWKKNEYLKQALKGTLLLEKAGWTYSRGKQ
jgi:hypothetical protein